MKNLRRVLLVSCLVIFSVIALTACGGDDDDDTEEVEATATLASEDEASPADDATEPPDEATEEPETDDDSGSGGSGEEISDPCSLVTQAEVEDALGESVQAPVTTYTGVANVGLTDAQATVGTCAYVSPTGTSSVNLNVWSSPGNDEEMAEMIETACANKETADGIGELACWYDDQHVEIQVGERSYFLDIFATMQGDPTDALLSISEAAVGRLP